MSDFPQLTNNKPIKQTTKKTDTHPITSVHKDKVKSFTNLECRF